MIKWLSINIHLIPSITCFFVGMVLLIIAPILYQIRIKKILIINPVKAIKKYNQNEKSLFIIGTVMIIIGIISVVLISEFYGYYYFKNESIQFLKP